MKQHEYFGKLVTDDEVEFIHHFIRTGFNGEKAVRFTWGLSSSGAYQKSKKLLSEPRIQSVIKETQESVMNELKINSQWVLKEALEVYGRCMQQEKVLDRNGDYTGEFSFDASNSLKCLKLIGDLTDVGAFTKKEGNSEAGEIMRRLNRGRSRASVIETSTFTQPPLPDESVHTPDTDIDFY